MHMFKIPKNRDVAEKWLTFLGIVGIEPNVRSYVGYLCNQHIKDEYMYKEKNRLKPIAAPATFSDNIGTFDRNAKTSVSETKSCQNVEKDIINITTSFAALAALNPVSSVSSTSSTIAMAKNDKHPCEQCMEKDDQIDKLEAKIRLLKRKLQCANKKVSYLKNVKTNLDKAFSDMKKQKIIDEEQCKLLKVIDIIICTLIQERRYLFSMKIYEINPIGFFIFNFQY